MRLTRKKFALPLLAVLTCALFAVGQDVPYQPATGYTYSPPIDFPEASQTYAFGINNAGEIVGFYAGAQCSQEDCGFTYLKGKFTSFECLPYSGTAAYDISNKAEVVGTYATNDGGAISGFIWEGENSCDPLSDPNGDGSTNVLGVNDSGELVGYYTDSEGNYVGFLDDSGTFSNIECGKNWADSRAYGINDAGLIVGDVSNSTAGPYDALLYESGKCKVFGYPKAASTAARGINKSDQISGWYTDSSGKTHGFLKTGSTFHGLNYPGALATLVFHINDKGQVAGWYEDAGQAIHGFVATPK
jgi:uncharacterized membrane protein